MARFFCQDACQEVQGFYLAVVKGDLKVFRRTEGTVPLENLEMFERKGIVFPLQFMGNVIPPTGPQESNSQRPWLMLVNTIRMMQACQRSRDQTQIAKGQSER